MRPNREGARSFGQAVLTDDDELVVSPGHVAPILHILDLI